MKRTSVRSARLLEARVEREVDRVVRQVEEERFVLVFADEADGFRGVEFHERLLVVRQDALHDLAIAEEWERWLSRAAHLRKWLAEVALHPILCRPHVIRIGKAEMKIEALRIGEEFRLVAKMPFSDDGGGIA